MNLRQAARACAATLAALALFSCAQPGLAPPVNEPTSTVSRVRVVNDSTEELRDLHLLFPREEVAIGDVAPGAASDYVEVAHGVYTYSAFRFQRGDESVVQPVVDFVGETPMPTDDYTYLLGLDPDKGAQLQIATVFRGHPTPAESPDASAVWVRVSNRGPADLVGYTMVFADQEIYFGSIPAGTMSQYTRLYNEGSQQLVKVKYTVDGRTVSEGALPGQAGLPAGNGDPAGAYTYVVGYNPSAPIGQQVAQLEVMVDGDSQQALSDGPASPS